MRNYQNPEEKFSPRADGADSSFDRFYERFERERKEREAAKACPPAPDVDAMRRHLEWHVERARKAYGDALIEIAWSGGVEEGPNRAKLFGLHELDAAAAHAARVNAERCNVYVGVTLKQPATPRGKRTRGADFYVATSIPVDMDTGAETALGRLRAFGKPGLVVTTGITPETRQQAWLRLSKPCADGPLVAETFAGLVDEVGGDADAKGLARVMRLAGSVSYPPENKRARGYVVEQTTLEINDLAAPVDIRTLPKASAPPRAAGSRGGKKARGPSARIMNGQENWPVWDELAEADLDNLLAHIDGADRENWHDVLKVLTNWTAAKPELEATLCAKFDRWSRCWPDKYNEQDQEKQWSDGLRRAAERRERGEALLGYGSLVEMAGGREVCPGPTVETAPSVEPNRETDPTRFRWTDAGNGLLFVALFKKDIRYIEAWKAWIVWDGSRWIGASDTAILPLARAATEHMFDWALKLPEDHREGLRKHALACQKEQRLRSMLNLAKGEASIRIEANKLDADPWLLGCPNGTLDLRTGALREARREDYITKQISVAYDAQAKCPNWEAFLNRAMQGDRATIEHLQRIVGYVLTGSVVEEKLFALFGGGDNGKTTFFMTLLEMLGDYADTTNKSILMEAQGEKGAASPDVAALQGKRLVVISETDDDCTIAEAQLKAITSNEMIHARQLYQNSFTFTPTHKGLLSTNHPPFVKGTDDGIWRRLDIIGFPFKITEAEKITDFRERKLRPELAGVLNWALDGLREYRRDGLKPSEAVKRATNEYRGEMDLMGQWLEDNTAPDMNAFVSKHDVYENYRNWAAIERVPHLGPRKFSNELISRGFKRAKNTAGTARGFKGLKLITLGGISGRAIQGLSGQPEPRAKH